LFIVKGSAGSIGSIVITKEQFPFAHKIGCFQHHSLQNQNIKKNIARYQREYAET